MRKIMIIGATSAIGEATARLFAADGDRFFLIARNKDKLDSVARNLTTLGAAQVETRVMDAKERVNHEKIIAQSFSKLKGMDIALIAYGTLSQQKNCEKLFAHAKLEIDTNLISVISWLTYLANMFEEQKHGTLAVISSVAGDRGRQSNYIYGTAKGAITIFTQGLRNRLYPSGVHVCTIKPGFVDTPMTKDFKKGLLWVKPDVIAKAIYGGINSNKDVIYTPQIWRFIMLIIRLIPEKLFKRLKL